MENIDGNSDKIIADTTKPSKPKRLRRSWADETSSAVVDVLYLGIVAYIVFIFIYFLGKPFNWLWIVSWVENKPAIYIFGLPLSALTAFGIVAVFNRWSPAEQQNDGHLSFKAFGAEFSGPAAPATLWIACFLALILALQVAAGIEANRPPENPPVSTDVKSNIGKP